MSDNFLTADDIINATRSPPLSPARIDYNCRESPPPLIEVGEEDVSDATESDGEEAQHIVQKYSKCRPQPSHADSSLISLLGPNYPEIALKAGEELITLTPEAAYPDRTPKKKGKEGQMVNDYARHVSRTIGEAQFLAVAAFEASQKLNAALCGNALSSSQSLVYVQNQREDFRVGMAPESHSLRPNSLTSITHEMSENVSHQNQKAFNVKPPPRISLPSIRTHSPPASSDSKHYRQSSFSTSPTLAKFVVGADAIGTNQQLPRMNGGSPILALTGTSQGSRQTLPSLETALSAIHTPAESNYSAHSPSLARPSPAPLSHFGPSPSSYSNPSPASAISPPRLPTAPSYWRTNTRETTNSTPSDHASTTNTNGVSTPASSIPGLSPAHSAHTPSTVIPDHDARHSEDPMLSNGIVQRHLDESQYPGAFSTGTFKCTYPGCTAPLFQTQYLLNSHANVHSSARPHFCPVDGCSRGPGGQGFKRKNEMIRHGLVHQSPGYVCPFCPDQQHKYPRPDNLQRHVRVHHVDRDRDDPLLREVLAQRPEGGNRGRRRRLGS